MSDRKWDTLSTTMNRFHSYFKEEFETLYELADSFNDHGMSLRLYLQSAMEFDRHLTMHHTIEERHVFPFLAQKMPQFSKDADDAHIASHKGIHNGLESLENLVQKWKKEPSSYSSDEMRACLDGFREVLFSHLDQEVQDLKGENLKKHWTLAEFKTLLATLHM